jgi:hypothetical protein
VPLGDALEQLADRIAAAGDADPPRQHLVDDQSGPLDGEVVEKIMQHLDGRLSPAALGQLKEMLEGGPDEYDWMPPGLRDKASRDQLERQIEHLDPRSASDALENIEAVELMRQRGNLERGSGQRMAERRGTEPWFPGQGERVAGDMPPPFPGRPTPGGHPLPGRQEHAGIDRRRIAGDSSAPQASTKQFAKFLGLKKKQLPGVAW